MMNPSVRDKVAALIHAEHKELMAFNSALCILATICVLVPPTAALETKKGTTVAGEVDQVENTDKIEANKPHMSKTGANEVERFVNSRQLDAKEQCKNCGSMVMSKRNIWMKGCDICYMTYRFNSTKEGPVLLWGDPMTDREKELYSSSG